MKHSVNRIQSKNYKIGTYEISKISFSCFDYIIYIQTNGYDDWISVIGANYEKIVSVLKSQIYFIFILHLQSNQGSSFYFFCFSTYKTVDNEYSTEGCNSPKIRIGAVMKNREMSKFVPDHHKTKRICKHVAKKLSLGIL